MPGVADSEHLGKVGVPVVHELRGVGKNMQDHYVARVSYPVVGAQTGNERSRRLPFGGEVMRWLFTGKGMLTCSPSIVAASVKVLDESAPPDVQCTFAPGSFKNGQIGELEETPGLSAGAWQMRPLSRGYVEAKSNRPGDAPAINPRYLSEEPDRRAIIGGLRLARRLFAAPALQRFVREESLPGAQIQTDDELLNYARRYGGTCYHSSCTSRRCRPVRFAPRTPMRYNVNIVCSHPRTAMSKSVTIAARVDADLDHELELLAEATGRSKSWLINEALRSYVANEQQFLAAVEDGKQALQAGQVVDHATVVAAFERVVKPHP